ncbi:helix-turn-helix domain-containing protein [Sphingomonas sp. SM33]|uniref:Helix-turn-helix domain-containing protein n=1 Tax=Sphingomonas telluris TaxID=2907998 RepID=A0ABS9VNS8_9SPHN|nr:helix-turn-helix domain-containing protein [Sphingomonas telluris]MCH8616353.1 helix-turn-helix domain-containing protein [Sphingomonas telluris]
MDVIATSVHEAAHALGVGRTTIYALIQNGRLATFKIGRRTLIPVESLKAFVGRQTPT